jgi:transposase
MPCCDTPAMTAHLAEISAMVDPGAHAVVILDQAGWHMSRALAVPQNITLLALPPRSPELNPVENIWQYLRENWLSNRVFESYDDIVTLACEAWNRLMDRPSRIPPRMGAWVLISASWYKPDRSGRRPPPKAYLSSAFPPCEPGDVVAFPTQRMPNLTRTVTAAAFAEETPDFPAVARILLRPLRGLRGIAPDGQLRVVGRWRDRQHAADRPDTKFVPAFLNECDHSLAPRD